MGPAHGAHSRPVATPSSAEESIAGCCTIDGCIAGRNAGRSPGVAAPGCDTRAPRETSGRASRSARPGKSSATPNTASRTMAAPRPNRLASTAQPPATAASVPTIAKVNAMPASIGSTLRAND